MPYGYDWLVNKRSELFVRIISGISVIAITFAFGIVGGAWFTLFVFAIMLITTYELWKLCIAAAYKPSLAVALLTAMAAFAGIRWPTLPILIPAMSIALLATLGIQLARTEKRRFGDWAVSFAGGFYIGWTCGHIAELRELANGDWWLLLTLACVWLADSGAYAFGRLFGRHKMAPAISPNKTWEGYAAGAITALLGGTLIGWVSPLGLASGVLTGGLIGVFSVMGDLIESLIKREAHAKDSGKLIPGHGGIFDRIDSLLWAGVIAFMVNYIVTTAKF
jgi:phosphatidate cytidylyltransferase